MHPSLDQLLTLRDRPAADHEDVVGHVRECAECHATLESARRIAARLRELPVRTTPPDRWLAIRTAFLARSAARSQTQRRRPGWLLPASSAAVVLCAVLLTVGSHGPQPAAYSQHLPGAHSVMPPMLIAESQRLEAVLASLPVDAQLTRAGTALTVAGLEDRIRWVDYRLSLANEAGINPRQADLLWRERVDLLNSLVAVRYADARTRAF
ncbi:MAG TPA: hypothetical protein VEZ88_09925 [Steroidobacteraceae bacterium]|nr:hypothetical protein [Steroidobacteraceae bacterium]